MEIFGKTRKLGWVASEMSDVKALRLRNRTNLMTARQSLNLILIITVSLVITIMLSCSKQIECHKGE